MPTISKLKNIKDIDPITDNLEGWTVTEGSPIMKTWILHTNNDVLMIRRPPRSTRKESSAASDVYKRQYQTWRKRVRDFGSRREYYK